MPPMSQPPPQDPTADVAKAASSAVQSLAMLFDAVHQTQPDSPIASAVQDLMKATSEVKRHITQVGPDLTEGTPDDVGDPTGESPEDMAAEPEGEPPAEGEMPPDEPPVPDAPVDPGPMGGGPFNEAGRGMNAALLDAAKRKQP